jgi:MoxR-like ATPase
MSNLATVPEPSKLAETFKNISDEMNTQLIERSAIVKACNLAVLAREHVFLLGPPGTAKSLAIQLYCSAIQGSQYFRQLLTRFSQPEELFGPPSLKGLQNDVFERLIKGYAPDCHILFLDEIWKASSSILNTLLTMVNERLYVNGNQEIKVPLISLFSASNELPEDSSLDALYDRFLLRYYVDRITDENNFLKLLKLPVNGGLQTSVSLKEIEAAQNEVKLVNPDPVLHTLVDLRSKLEREAFIFSDRRWKKSITLLQANAWLDQRMSVSTDDIEVLADVLWSKPDERRAILKHILSVSSPGLEKALEFFDIASEIHKTAIEEADTAAGMEANDKFKDNIIPQMEALPTSDRLTDLIQQVRTMQREVSKVCLGF